MGHWNCLSIANVTNTGNITQACNWHWLWVWGQSGRTEPLTCRIWQCVWVGSVTIELNCRTPSWCWRIVWWWKKQPPIGIWVLRTIKVTIHLMIFSYQCEEGYFCKRSSGWSMPDSVMKGISTAPPSLISTSSGFFFLSTLSLIKQENSNSR